MQVDLLVAVVLVGFGYVLGALSFWLAKNPQKRGD